MKFVKENKNDAITIPAAIVQLSGLADTKKLELHTVGRSIAVLKGQMTAMELIHTVEALKTLASDLTVHLAKACGPCHDCEECPCEDFDDDERVTLPDFLLDAIGLPADAKLEAIVDEDAGTVTIGKAEYEHDLTDVPEDFLDVLFGSGVCIARLEEALVTGGIVYGG